MKKKKNLKIQKDIPFVVVVVNFLVGDFCMTRHISLSGR